MRRVPPPRLAASATPIPCTATNVGYVSNAMRIAVLGPTGGTGKSLLEQGLAAGHELRAIARRPDAVELRGDKLEVVRADVFEIDSLTDALRDVDVVVFCVGVASLWQARKPTTVYSQGCANVLQAMQAVGVERLIVVSSGGVEPQPNDPWFFTKILKPLFLEGVYEDMRKMEALLRASPLDWTIVRPPYLTNKQLTGRYRLSRGKNFDDDKDLGRADLAHFLLAESTAPQFHRELVASSY